MYFGATFSQGYKVDSEHCRVFQDTGANRLLSRKYGNEGAANYPSTQGMLQGIR